MVETRYQAFVSSTYEDLKEERREVTQALLELDCLPAGMEMFVAATDEQWTLIEEVIGVSDYYILIIGGRYGSLTEEGISYTEKEFDLALKIKIPVLVFVPENPDEIPQGKTDKDDKLRRKLEAFKKRAMTGRTVAFYSGAHDLGSQVSRALVRTMKKHPGIGWVRGDQAMTVEQQREIINLREQINRLESEKLAAQTALVEDVSGLANGSEEVTIPLIISDGKSDNIPEQNIAFTSTWDAIFAEIGPKMLDEATEAEVEERLEDHLLYSTVRSAEAENGVKPFSSPEAEIYTEDWDMVSLQLRALGLIDTGTKKRPQADQRKYLTLTDKGRRHLMTLRAVKKGVNPGAQLLNQAAGSDAEDPFAELDEGSASDADSGGGDAATSTSS